MHHLTLEEKEQAVLGEIRQGMLGEFRPRTTARPTGKHVSAIDIGLKFHVSIMEVQVVIQGLLNKGRVVVSVHDRNYPERNRYALAE